MEITLFAGDYEEKPGVNPGLKTVVMHRIKISRNCKLNQADSGLP
jgi:hypothetical protein